MALLEADQVGGKIDPDSARNALGAMINRAARDGVDIGQHVSGKIYQPTIEDAQFQRLSRIVGSPEHQQLMALYDARVSGQAPDWVQGATHFLAPEKTMLSLEAQDPAKYRSWRKWTGFDDNTGEYRGVTLRDRSHAFLAPEGAYSAKFGDGAPGAAPAAPGAMPATTEPTATPTPAAPAPGGGMLGALFARTPDAAPDPNAATMPNDKGGWLSQLGGALTSDPTPGEGKGGWLSQLGADLTGSALDERQQAEDQKRQAALLGDDPAADPFANAMKQRRGPVDMKRLASILQSRSRIGS